MFGYTSSEAIGKCVHDLVVPKSMCKEARERIEISVKIFNETGTGYFTVGNVELMGRRKNDNEFPARIINFTNKDRRQMECSWISKRHY